MACARARILLDAEKIGHALICATLYPACSGVHLLNVAMAVQAARAKIKERELQSAILDCAVYRETTG